MAPPQVGVVTLQPSPRPYIRELPGRIAPTRVAEVRARVSGIVVERTFQQGTDVKAGDVLYRIDPVRSRSSSQATEAALAKAQAVLDQAEQQAKRVEKLIAGQRRLAGAARNRDRRRCARPRPTSPPARPTSRARSSISTTRPYARRSAAASAARW